MVWQTDNELKQPIQDEGCALLCMLKKTGKDWTSEEVNDIYQRLVLTKIIGPDCFIHSWQQLSDFLSLNSLYLGWGTVKQTLQLMNNYWWISRWHNEATGLYHFALPDWDPLNGSATIAGGYICDNRLFRILA